MGFPQFDDTRHETGKPPPPRAFDHAGVMRSRRKPYMTPVSPSLNAFAN